MGKLSHPVIIGEFSGIVLGGDAPYQRSASYRGSFVPAGDLFPKGTRLLAVPFTKR